MKMKKARCAIHPPTKRILRASIAWLLALALCWQAALPALAARKERRGKPIISSRSKSSARPVKRRAAQTNSVNVVTVSAASFESAVAPESIVAAFGSSLATKAEAAKSLPLPTTLAGTAVTLRDSKEIEHAARLFYVSREQVNFLVPSETSPGEAVVTIISADGIISQGTVEVSEVAPGVFTANSTGRGVPAASLIRVRNGQLIYESLLEPDPVSVFRPRPIDPGPDSDRLFLVLYLTGVRRAPDPNKDGNANESVRVIIGNLEITPDYAGSQREYEGLDQINVELPRSLAGRGRLDVVVTVNGFNSSNVTEIEFGPLAGAAPPQIGGFSPTTATAGETITINGSGFSANPAENLVRIGGLEASVTAASATQLTVTAPFGVETAPITVRMPQGEGASAGNLQVRTSLSGQVETTSRQPLAGVTVKAGASQTTTNAEGVFLLTGMSPGMAVVEIDGGGAQPASSYPKVLLRAKVDASRDNQIARPIALQFTAGASVSVSDAGALTEDSIIVPAATGPVATGPATTGNRSSLTAAEAGSVIFDLPSGATVSFPDGAATGRLVLTQLENSRAPVSLPRGHFSSNILQIAPYGATFSQGGRIVFPNSDGLAASATVKLFKLDQNPTSEKLGNFIEAGAATVSSDGKTIETRAGVITESGCYFVSAPRSIQTLIGRVVDGGAPVRRALVTARGQESLTDGNGGFTLRYVPARQGDTARIDAAYLRPKGRAERVARDFTIPVTILPVGFVRVTPDLALPGAEDNRPPVIIAPTSLSVAVGEAVEVDVFAFDRDSDQKTSLEPSGPLFATLNPPGCDACKLRVAPGDNNAGAFTITLTARDGAGASTTHPIALNVTAPAPRIIDFNPKSGVIGSEVVVTGSSLKSALGNPTVTFAGANGTRLQAFVSTPASANEVKVTVPNGAVTGAIDLTTSLGRVVTPGVFTVDPSQSFTLTVENPTATALQGGTGTFVVRLNSSAPNFSQVAKLSLAGAPTGAEVKFEPEQITAGATSTMSVGLLANTPSRNYELTISAKAIVDGVEMTRTVQATLTAQPVTQTTLSGRVLSTKNEPIPGVMVTLDGQSDTTDAAGSFILRGVNAGPARPVMVDGSKAAVPANRTYPIIKEPINIVANQANVMPYIFYLPEIDNREPTMIDPSKETKVTTSEAPGLELKIPVGGLEDLNGNGVPSATLTCVEIDRTPAPLPTGVGANMVYTAQPGGSRPKMKPDGTRPVMPVTYPNLAGANPGTRIALWNFDHKMAQWYIYGYGRVSADGRLIEPEPGTGLPDFSWHFPNAAPEGNPAPPDQCPSARTGNTVDLATGVKIEMNTDISFGGARGGLELTRIYSSDLGIFCDSCAFGRGARHNYDIRLTGSFQSGGAGRLRMPEQGTGRLFSFAGPGPSGSLLFTTTATSGQLADVITKLANGTFEYRKGNGEVWRFDSQGRLTAMVDRNGNTTTLSYTGANLTRVTDTVGRSINLEYAGSLISRVTDPLGRVWRYNYNGELLTTVTDPLGFTTTYSYTFPSLLTSVTDARGIVKKKITYLRGGDGALRVSKQEFADGGFETYDYKFSGTVVTEAKVTGALGRVMIKRFNAAGYVIGETDELGQSSVIERFMLTNLARKVTGPCGCAPEATRTFDERGNVTSFMDRKNQKTEYEYDPNFTFVTMFKDALGRATRMAYDNRGNRVSMTDALGRITAYVYDSFGQLISVTDPLGHSTRFGYDAHGYVNRVTDALGDVTAFEYDAVGRLKKIIDGEGRDSSIAYDDNDRVTSSADPAGIVTRYEYDQNGNRTAIINAQGKRWTFAYDPKSRLNRSADPLNQTTRYRYNSDDELVAVVSPSGRAMRFEYDSRGQRVKIVDPLRGEIRFTYDNRKNLTTLTDQRGSTTTFIYDELYRLIAQRDPLGRATTFGYDAISNLIEKIDRLNRRVMIDYDALNRPATIRYVDATVNYNFDEAGRLIKIDDTQSAAIEWVFDGANRMLSEKTPQGLVRYAYNKAHQRVSMTAADRPQVSYEYDPAGRLQKITQSDETFTWSYDDLSRMGSLQRPNGVTTTYSYDAADKLNRITHANAFGVPLEDLQYEYNSDNEIESIASMASGTLLPTPKNAGPADAANRVARFGQASYTFDEEGQTLAKIDAQGTTTYDWDARGRLGKVTLPNGQMVSYSYDALGRRISRAANGLTNSYLYDGLGTVLDRSIGSAPTDYLNGTSVDRLLRQTNADSGSLYFLHDHLNSTIGLTTQAGGLAERLRYEAYGSGVGSSFTRFDYTGRERDLVVGLMYYRARWYDPQQGRLLTEDPIGLAGGINLYSYVGDNPLSYTDPSGLISAASTCNGDKDPCDDLRTLIQALIEELRRRYFDLLLDKDNLFRDRPTGEFSFEGHQEKYRNKQAQLRKSLDKFINQGCGGGVPTDALSWLSKPAPARPLFPYGTPMIIPVPIPRLPFPIPIPIFAPF